MTTSATGPDSSVSAAAVTRDTGTFRSGAAAWKYDSGAGSAAGRVDYGGGNNIASRTVFLRVYARWAAAPSSQQAFIGDEPSGSPRIGVKMKTDGTLQLFQDATAQGSASAAVTDSTWHRVELSYTIDSGGLITAAEFLLDGTSIGTFSGSVSGSVTGFNPFFGYQAAPGANFVAYFDDAARNDSTGAANNSWCGDGAVILMEPVSDNARGNWTAGAGGTTNLFDGVNNTPPVGVADASATNGSQIKIKSTTLPSNCDLNLNSYTTEGVTGTVNAITLWVNHGEDPATGTKAGTAAIVSNPASGTVSFNFGNDVGAQSTYFGLWAWNSLLVDAPSVTLGTAPVIRVTCTSGSTGTRAASCDFLGAYVEYTPAAAAAASLLLDNPNLAVIRR